jgi:hypothetical protein
MTAFDTGCCFFWGGGGGNAPPRGACSCYCTAGGNRKRATWLTPCALCAVRRRPPFGLMRTALRPPAHPTPRPAAALCSTTAPSTPPSVRGCWSCPSPRSGLTWSSRWCPGGQGARPHSHAWCPPPQERCCGDPPSCPSPPSSTPGTGSTEVQAGSLLPPPPPPPPPLVACPDACRFVHVSSAGVTRPNRPGINVDQEPPAVKLNDALGGLLTYKLAGGWGARTRACWVGRGGLGRGRARPGCVARLLGTLFAPLLPPPPPTPRPHTHTAPLPDGLTSPPPPSPTHPPALWQARMWCARAACPLPLCAPARSPRSRRARHCSWTRGTPSRVRGALRGRV